MSEQGKNATGKTPLESAREDLYAACKRWGSAMPPDALREIMGVVDQLERCAKQRIDMVLFCPSCGLQHVDGPEEPAERDGGERSAWQDPPHRSHRCRNPGCRHVWRPSDVVTNGVAEILTRGKDDSPSALPMGVQFEASEYMSPAEVRAIREHNRALSEVMSLRPFLAKILGHGGCP